MYSTKCTQVEPGDYMTISYNAIPLIFSKIHDLFTVNDLISFQSKSKWFIIHGNTLNHRIRQNLKNVLKSRTFKNAQIVQFLIYGIAYLKMHDFSAKLIINEFNYSRQ